MLNKPFAVSAILKKGKGATREAPLNAYLEVLLRANPRVFLEAWRMANDTKTFEEVFTEAGIIPQWIEQGIERGIEQGIEQGIERGIEQGIERGEEKKALAIAKNLLAKGWAVEDIAETTELPSEKVRSLVID
jgi:predicted transposase/invertase (TIGR01784 family)